jgi:hypothetical protein
MQAALSVLATVAPAWRTRSPKTLARVGILAAIAFVSACAASAPALPPPRPIIIHSGARIRADHEEMEQVNEWVTREQANIVNDPSFWVVSNNSLSENFPWEGMRVVADSVILNQPLGGRDAQLVYQIYGHLHLMVEMGRQEEWLPEAPEATGYELERAIAERVADAWILGRTVFDTQPFTPMDELAYAKHFGFIDAFIFTARPGEFGTDRAEWARANPGRTDEYRDWFLETFNTEPPGIRANE